MWCLISSEGARIPLDIDTHVTLGRKKGQIELKNDNSISKMHASIIVKRTKRNSKGHNTICKLQDLNSKYGTYVSSKGGEFVIKDNCVLENGDKIRFGLQNHIFTIQYVPLVTLTSTISENDKKRLETLFNELDGVISEEWNSSCTHLTVTCALLTEKVVWAMTSCMPIVTIAYWEHLKKAIAAGANLPDVNKFVPLIQEGLINKDKVSLLPNEARKKLFNDLIFIFFSATQFKVYGKMVHLAGGKSVLFGKKKLTVSDLCLPNVVAVQFPEDYASQSTEALLPEYEEICEQMRSKSIRIVPDREIPLAILHCSIKSYCNPWHRYKLLRLDTQIPDLGEVQVPETQDTEKDVRPLPTVISDIRVKAGVRGQNNHQLMNVIIPETCDFLSGGDTNTESDAVLDPTKKSQPDIKKHPDHSRKAGDESMGSDTEKEIPKPKEYKIPTEPEKQIKTSAAKVSCFDDAIIKSGIVPETLEEPEPTQNRRSQRYSNRDLKAEEKESRSFTEKQCPKLNESAASAKSLIKGNIKKKVASPVNADHQKKIHGIVIPETLDILDSIKSSRPPIPLSPEVIISPIRKKQRVLEEHVETLAKLPERSPTLRVCDEVSPNRLKINPVSSQANKKVVNWLAVMDNFTEETSDNLALSLAKSQRLLLPAQSEPGLSPVKFEPGLSPIKSLTCINENVENQIDETPINRFIKKHNRTPINAEDVGEYIPPTKKHLTNRAALSPTNAIRSITSHRPSYLRLNPVNKMFKKAKVLIPAQRISVKNMKAIV